MAEHPSKRTLEGLETMIQEIQYFLDHPRTQQNRWVAKGHTWIPVLRHAKEDLQTEIDHYDIMIEAYQAIWTALKAVGLEIKQRDRTTWAYTWNGAPLVGVYASRAEALEAALRERVAK
jgi:hypothetical protein